MCVHTVHNCVHSRVVCGYGKVVCRNMTHIFVYKHNVCTNRLLSHLRSLCLLSHLRSLRLTFLLWSLCHLRNL
jgi:hypothetical protein